MAEKSNDGPIARKRIILVEQNFTSSFLPHVICYGIVNGRAPVEFSKNPEVEA